MNRKDKALEFANDWDIKITGRHVEVTDSMKDYAIEKISKIERFINRIIDVNIIMDIQKLEHRVEIILTFGSMKVSSTASSTDMYASIDKAVDKLAAQLRRYKSKIQDHHAKGLSIIDMNVNVLKKPAEEDEVEFDEEITQDNRFHPHAIIKQETSPLKTLTYDEAVMKMDLSGDGFLIFKSEEDQKLKVIYSRKDGNYGIIEPVL
jgi:putative sigma-54 modulation protein